MKKILALTITFLILLGMIGCSQEPPYGLTQDSSSTEPQAELPTETVSAAPLFPETVAAVCLPATTVTEKAEDGTVIFSYTYQNIYPTLPNSAVADKVIIHYLDILDRMHNEAQTVYYAAADQYDGTAGFMPYSCQLLYNTMRIDHGVLSLFGEQISYSGGGHAVRTGVSMNFDMLTGDPLLLGSIMHADATTEQFAKKIIHVLKESEQLPYLFEDYQSTVELKLSGEESQFDDFYFTQTGLCFYFDTYEIAPYSSGIITVEIPYADLTGLINDAYFPAERESASGNLLLTGFSSETVGNYSSITEAVLHEDGERFICYTDGNIHNIRILAQTTDDSHAVYTLYAANGLDTSSTVVLQVNNTVLKDIMIIYENQNGSQEIRLSE